MSILSLKELDKHTFHLLDRRCQSGIQHTLHSQELVFHLKTQRAAYKQHTIRCLSYW